jgi:hypothetical protein
MISHVDGLEFPNSNIIYNDQGFGRDPGLPVQEFSVNIPIIEFLENFTPKFNEFIRECEQDDSNQQVSDIPEVKEAGYPVLNEAVEKYPKLVSDLICDYLYFDFLEAIYGRNKRENWEFAVNGLLGADVHEQVVVVRGNGYRLD